MTTEKVLGPLGQLAPTYTLLTLAFPLEDESQEAPVISTLERAADEIIQSYPWLAGQVVLEGRDETAGDSGTYKIVRYEPHEAKSRFIYVKDCKDLVPSYQELLSSRAPASQLDGSILSPGYGFTNFYPSDVVTPVCLMQANFIDGGLLLTIATYHCVVDANGNEQLIHQFASLCRGEKLSQEYIRAGNLDPNTIVPPLDPGQEPISLDNIRAPSQLGAKPGEWPPLQESETWRTFRFPRASIALLKTEASKLCSPDSDIKYISSNDAVSSFMWTRLAAARAARLPKSSKTTLIRAVNGRRRLDTPIHEGYMGHSIMCCFATLPLEDAVNGPLSAAAIATRRSIGDINDHAMRSFFHLLQTEKDKTTINYGASMDAATDIMITSWVAQKLYDTSFGDVLQKPAFMRRPRLPNGPGMCYFMPLTREGDIDVVASLWEVDFEGLQADAKWREFVEFLG